MQLIDDILDISKIESGKLEFIYSDFSLNSIFKPQEPAFLRRVNAGVKVVFENDGCDYSIISEKTSAAPCSLQSFLIGASVMPARGARKKGLSSIKLPIRNSLMVLPFIFMISFVKTSVYLDAASIL